MLILALLGALAVVAAAVVWRRARLRRRRLQLVVQELDQSLGNLSESLRRALDNARTGATPARVRLGRDLEEFLARPADEVEAPAPEPVARIGLEVPEAKP